MDETLRNELRSKLNQPKTRNDLVIEKVKIIEVSGADLIAAIKANPDHLAAKSFSKSAIANDPNTKMYVDAADFEALIENVQVKCKSTINSDGFSEVTKYLEGSVPPSTPQVDSPDTAPGESTEDIQE